VDRYWNLLFSFGVFLCRHQHSCKSYERHVSGWCIRRKGEQLVRYSSHKLAKKRSHASLSDAQALQYAYTAALGKPTVVYNAMIIQQRGEDSRLNKLRCSRGV
jgi:hypothetical protein